MGLTKGIKILVAIAVVALSGTILFWAYSFDRALSNAPFLNAFHPTTETLWMRGLVGLVGLCAAVYLLRAIVNRSH